MDVVEALLRWLEGADVRLGVPADFAALTGEAGSGPAAHVAIHTGPDEPLRDELDGGLDARVRQVVQSLGEGPAQRLWEDRPRRSVFFLFF